jgi:hypothetical protein
MANVTKLIAALKRQHPELADDPILDEIEGAAGEPDGDEAAEADPFADDAAPEAEDVEETASDEADAADEPADDAERPLPKLKKKAKFPFM